MYAGELIILRGLPGAGKSTLAGILSEGGKYPVFSVDDFFTNYETGEYTFNFSENHLAYKACLEQTEMAMKETISKIFIHNTLTLQWELELFTNLAKKYNYRTHIVTVENHHDGKNSHAISPEQIQKMAGKFKPKLF